MGLPPEIRWGIEKTSCTVWIIQYELELQANEISICRIHLAQIVSLHKFSFSVWKIILQTIFPTAVLFFLRELLFMPTLTYVSVGPHDAFPIRVFVHRRKLLASTKSSVVAVNQRSILHLSRINIIRLSNADLDSLVSNIRHSLMDVLLNLVTFVLDKTDWKCYVKVPVHIMLQLRFYLNSLTNRDQEWLEQKNIHFSKCDTELLTRETKYLFKQDPDDDNELVLEKKESQYSIGSKRIIIPKGISIYVYSRPPR